MQDEYHLSRFLYLSLYHHPVILVGEVIDMKIKIYINGALSQYAPESIARHIADILKRERWEVRELYEIGYLVLFPPFSQSIKLS